MTSSIHHLIVSQGAAFLQRTAYLLSPCPVVSLREEVVCTTLRAYAFIIIRFFTARCSDSTGGWYHAPAYN